MSFVTFVRDYIQDPDKIVHIPSFIFDACRELLWYIFSFQWLRNLTYVTLSLAYPEGLSSDSGTGTIFNLSPLENLAKTQNNGVASFSGLSLDTSLTPKIDLSTIKIQVSDFLTSSGLPISIPNGSGFAQELNHSQFSTGSALTHSAYGFFNGITSNFHFCAITIIIAHIILNENKNRAFRIATISCIADLSCMIAVLLGFRGLIIPWFTAEPLGYFLGFAIQFYFALEIIKDNRRIKSFEPKGSKKVKDSQEGGASGSGRLSYNYWLVPACILFSWCEQTQFFQTLASNGFQPTATLMGLPFVASGNGANSFSTWQNSSNLLLPNLSGDKFGPDGISGVSNIDWMGSALGKERDLQILVYLLSYIITRLVLTWIGLSIFQKVINWKNNNYFRPFAYVSKVVNLIETEGKKRRFKSWVPRFTNISSFTGINKTNKPIIDVAKGVTTPGQYSGTLAPPRKIQHILRDPLAIAAVTCSFAFLPSYSTNLLLTKSVGFFPEESRVENSFFSPWDMPAEVLASDMDFISSHHNLAEYPFFLPFYDKGEYGGWLGVGEEDIRYGPFRLWQTRRIRAPWRRTTLQEPALTYANDKSLFVNPNPNPRKEESTSITFGQPLANSSLPLPLQDTSLAKPAKLRKKEIQDSLLSNEAQYESITSPTSPLQIPLIAQENLRGTRKTHQEVLKNSGKDLGEPKDLSSAFLWRIPVAESSLSNNTITKNGRKRLIEGFKKPVRKMSTSKLFNLSTFPLSESGQFSDKENHPSYLKLTPMAKSSNQVRYGKAKQSGVRLGDVLMDKRQADKKQEKGFRAIPYRIGGFIDTFCFSPLVSISEKVTSTFKSEAVGLESELQIKNTKQIRKRFKKFKKRVRLFRNKSYKKRNTKIRRLKHFHYLRNKKKKRRKSRRLIYKLRRQFPYIRNIKERKAEIFGLYSPVSPFISSLWGTKGIATPSNSGLPYGSSPVGNKDEVYDQKNFGDSNLFSTEGYAPYNEAKMHGESGEGYQSKIPSVQSKNNEKYSYDRGYPKNKGSRNSKKDFNLIFRTQIGERLDFAQEEIRARIFMNPYIKFLLNKRIDNLLSREGYQKMDFVSSSVTAAPAAQKISPVKSTNKPSLAEQAQNPFHKVFSSHRSAKLTADTEEKLFKRRLIISKYADAIDFLKPNSRHSYVDRIYNHQFKGTLSTARRLFSLKVQYDQPLIHSKNYEPVLEHEDFIKGTTPTYKPSRVLGQDSTDKVSKETFKESDHGGFLEKSSTAPFYAAWDESSRKLVFTNRYLDYKLATRGETKTESKSESKVEKNYHQQFTSWPLKEPYFKDNEFLVSQLYSNSQPIDSFLSQENEKARSVTLPRRVSSFNTVLSYKNSVPPTDAQRSQQLFKIENNDRKTFLFKHLWTTSNTAVSFKGEPSLGDNKTESKVGMNQKFIKENDFINKNKYKLPTSAEQKKTTRMEEREYPLWMVLRTLAPNQGGFLWPGD